MKSNAKNAVVLLKRITLTSRMPLPARMHSDKRQNDIHASSVTPKSRDSRTNNIFNKGNERNKKTHRCASSCSRETVGFYSSGQNPLLSHTIAIAFSVFLVLAVITVLTGMRDDYSGFVGRDEIAQVCLIIRGGIEKIFVDDSYASPANTTKGKILLRLPERIADQSYRARFVNSSLVIETASKPRVNDTCKPGFNATYLGFTNGGRTEINFTVRDNGDKIIAMMKV